MPFKQMYLQVVLQNLNLLKCTHPLFCVINLRSWSNINFASVALLLEATSFKDLKKIIKKNRNHTNTCDDRQTKTNRKKMQDAFQKKKITGINENE